MALTGAQVAGLQQKIKRTRPLIHHITNLVVMNDTANLTLHLGALPVMAQAAEEVAAMTRTAAALLLNMGTLTPAALDAMRLAGREANRCGVPVVLDPVGAGATPYRTEAARQLLEDINVAIVRGNSGEVAAIIGQQAVVRGVESLETALPAAELGAQAAQQLGVVVALTGARDIISDGSVSLAVDHGSPWLKTITGSGCMASAAVACFAAVAPSSLQAAAAALAAYGLAAELAHKPQIHGPASFKVALLDAVYGLTAETLQRAKVSVL